MPETRHAWLAWLRDPAFLELALAYTIAGNYIPADDIVEGRAYYRRLSLKPIRDADLELYASEVGGVLNLESLTNGDHVAWMEGCALCDEYESVYDHRALLWVTDWRDLLPGHFTWV